ncbi:APC amino acid permease [Panus rudis PR-1116 ss-1]|nr:APC amino acid permease [Panus rudis PR-1116 ss-1]
MSSNDADAAALARLGYKQEFKRAFTPLEVFGIGFSIIGLVPSIASVLVYALPNGGPTALVWGWAVCSVFLIFIAMALAELGSAAPTSGGLYFWTYRYAAPRWKTLLSWVCGYSNTIGNIAAVASVDWGCAVQLMAAVSIGSDMTFAPSTQQIFGVYAALLICHACIASLATAVIARLQGVYIVLNVLLCLAIIIAVPAATPSEFRNKASYAFGGFDNLYGWPNGFAFVLSFLAPLWSIGGFDSSVHISEEASNASVAVPWATVGAASIAGILGWAINVALSFCMGTDIENIMSNPIGQPMATIIFNSLGKKGTLAIWSIIVFVQFLMGTSMLTVCSRQIFAFSRDGALPGSYYIYRINPRTLTPVNSVWFAAFFALLLGLLAFAGPSAISAIFSLVVAGQYLAYSLPIGSRFFGGQTWEPGPFTLGWLGKPVAFIALAWMLFSVVVLSFPTTPTPTAQDMNYTVVVYGGWIVLCLIYYYLPVYGGKHWFTGPRANIEKQPVEDDESSAGGEEKAEKVVVQWDSKGCGMT